MLSVTEPYGVLQIRASHSVVVIGGGATGTELAVELAVEFPEKDVTLVHSRDELIAPGFTDKFQSKLRGILDRYHVQYKLGARTAVVLADVSPVYEDVSTICVGLHVQRPSHLASLH